MQHALLLWDELPWQQGSHPLEHKKVCPGQPCVLLMFLPGFADPSWCERSHVLHVLEGVLTMELREGRALCATGETLTLPPGTAHRARNEGAERVVLLAISDLPWPTPSSLVPH